MRRIKPPSGYDFRRRSSLGSMLAALTNLRLQFARACDPTRSLPETDPYSRQITMGHGTFLEMVIPDVTESLARRGQSWNVGVMHAERLGAIRNAIVAGPATAPAGRP